MHLSTRLAGEFSAPVRRRGEQYYRQGLVRIRDGSDSLLKARVRGSSVYSVSLHWEAGSLSASCDCPYYGSDGPCKHLWATILAADAHGYLSAALAATNVILDVDGDGDPDDEFDQDTLPPSMAVAPRKLTHPSRLAEADHRDFERPYDRPAGRGFSSQAADPLHRGRAG